MMIVQNMDTDDNTGLHCGNIMPDYGSMSCVQGASGLTNKAGEANGGSLYFYYIINNMAKTFTITAGFSHEINTKVYNMNKLA